jgi:hypothetical protein
MKHATWCCLAAGLLLLARGASAGDDGQHPAPAQPVDVPGFWTADELRRIDEGLDVLNCTRKDLGFQKRPIDDPFRLPVVNRILDDPLSIGPVAAEWDVYARGGRADHLWVHAAVTLGSEGAPQIHVRYDDSDRDVVARFPAASRLSLGALIANIGAFRAEILAAFKPLGTDRDAFIRKALLSQVEHPAAVPDATDIDDATFLRLAQKVDRQRINSAWPLAIGLIGLIEKLKAVPTDQLPDLQAPLRVKTTAGDVVIYGKGDDIHGPEDDDAVLVIDLGGNDTYTHSASANLLKNRPVQVVIDLAGDDRYIGENDFSFGGALGGVAIQWDCGGNDTYRGGNCSCGAGILGVGILVDEGGDDVYRVKDFGEGAGAFGIGLLLDKAGNDSYHADLYGQGFASTWGCGMLIELAGNDVYDAGGAHVDEPLWRDRYQSLSQGFAMGGRPDRSGGVGVLVDVSGNDRYSCDIFGQGCSYWYSLGLLIDDDGHDTYCCGQYGQGSGIHLSCGMLLDRHGQDCYYDANGVGQGGAHDYGVGFLVDREGDDYYSGGGCAQGSGHTNSVGMLIDDAGDDGYSTVRGISQGSASWTRNTGGIGLLLDGAGKDFYSESTRNDRVAVRDTIGACIDEPTPDEKPSANPMNAAISKEDAVKKVEAEGKKDGAWDLDKLWALVTAWEVGDNTVVMPIAREKWFTLGKPALDRAFENLNDKHGLIYRGVELTLAEFAKSDRAAVIARLVEKSKDADATIRKNAVRLLASLTAKEALPRLVEMLSADADSQTSVLAALATLKTAPPEVVALLKSPKESVGVQAAVCLGAVGDDRAIAALVAALGPDFAFPVRLAATDRLAALGEKAVAVLGEAALDTKADRMFRRGALRALGGTKSRDATVAVRGVLADPDRWVRLSAMLAAGELLQAFPQGRTDGGEPSPPDAVGALRAELTNARAAETDPLVKRLVLSSATK